MKPVNEFQWAHRIQLKDGTYTPGFFYYGPDGGDWPTTRFGLPDNLTNKTVLDIGTYNGFFAFEAEKRGGIVTAVDCDKREGYCWENLSDPFMFVKENLNSSVKYFKYCLQDDPEILHQYDLVLCYGVLYHMVEPERGMINLAKLTKPGGTCLIETAISTFNEFPILQYRPGYGGDNSNRYYPNDQWIEASALFNGFTSYSKIFNGGSRATYKLTKGL